MTHKATYEITRYPASSHAAKIVYRCACGKIGTLHDGARGLSLKRAQAAHAAHAKRAATREDRAVLRLAAYRLMLARYDAGKPMEEVRAARREWEALGGGYAYPNAR